MVKVNAFLLTQSSSYVFDPHKQNLKVKFFDKCAYSNISTTGYLAHRKRTPIMDRARIELP